MKNRYLGMLFVVAITLMFLAGCGGKTVAPSTEEPTVQEETPVKAPTKTVTKAPVEAPAEEEVAPAEASKVPSSKIKDLLGKHVGRIDSLRYMYQDATNQPEEWETWIKGDKMHVKLREMDNVRGDVYVSDIYLDLASKKAVGYCEQKVYRCPDPNTAIEVNFNKYYRETPIEWIETVTYAEKETEEQMQQRTVWKIFFTEGTKKTSMWVDDYYGVPMKVRVVDAGTTNDYVFEDLSINGVEDFDLEHGAIKTTYQAD